MSCSTSDINCYYDGACAVHGFVNATYSVVEEERLDTFFHLNVKGESRFGGALSVSGIIIAVAGGTASK